jgi:hypothetical protein
MSGACQASTDAVVAHMRDYWSVEKYDRLAELRAMGLNDRDLRRSPYFEMDYAELEKRVLAHVVPDPDDMEAMRAKPPVKRRGSE